MKYRWQAKGRHGTHSPFAYAFVEQVLRSKERPELHTYSVFSKSEARLFKLAIQYSSVRKMLIPENLYHDIVQLLAEDVQLYTYYDIPNTLVADKFDLFCPFCIVIDEQNINQIESLTVCSDISYVFAFRAYNFPKYFPKQMKLLGFNYCIQFFHWSWWIKDESFYNDQYYTLY